MAKILAKLFSSDENKIAKLRKKYDWTIIELDSLEEKYAEEKQKKLDKKLRKANKKLARPAYLACDKIKYIDRVNAEKLCEYDIDNYLSYRAANHGAAKKIFADIKKKRNWKRNLKCLDSKIEKIRVKRQRYFTKLEKNKVYRAKKLPTDSGRKYKSLYESLKADYLAYERKLDSKYSSMKARETSKITRNINALNNKIDRIIARKNRVGYKLPDGVLLEVKNLKMHFGGLKAVDDLSFNVKKGEIFGLIGPNGAGKTTVFNCITRFYDATGGDVHFENKYGQVVDMRDFRVHDVILQGIGRTFQNIELVKEISVLENLLVASTRSYKTGFIGHALGFKSLKKEEELLRKKAEGILKFMGIDNYKNWLAMGLPYGILKKVEIARALMADAKLIIMDEPAAGLNDSETAELTETIKTIRDKFGVTILLVEHDMGLVMNVCDTICAISFGQMLAIGTPEEIQKNKAVQEAYLGVEEGE